MVVAFEYGLDDPPKPVSLKPERAAALLADGLRRSALFALDLPGRARHFRGDTGHGTQKRHFGFLAACAAVWPQPGRPTAAVQIHKPDQWRMQMDRENNSAFEAVKQQLMERDAPMRDAIEATLDGPEGMSPMQALLGAVINAAMLIERERHTEARPHERAEGRQG